MEISDVKLDYRNKELCSLCKGKCCQAIPGIALPEDFGAPDKRIMLTRIRDALISGRWIIDWWIGDPRRDYDGPSVGDGLFIRPAVNNQEGRIRHPMWNGKCTFLTTAGCSLEHAARPAECRALEPNPEFLKNKDASCVSHIGEKQDFAIAWIDYIPTILEAENQARLAIEGANRSFQQEAAQDRLRHKKSVTLQTTQTTEETT